VIVQKTVNTVYHTSMRYFYGMCRMTLHMPYALSPYISVLVTIFIYSSDYQNVAYWRYFCFSPIFSFSMMSYRHTKFMLLSVAQYLTNLWYWCWRTLCV